MIIAGLLIGAFISLTLFVTTKTDSVNAYSQITLQDYEPAQIHRCVIISDYSRAIEVISNTASNLLSVKAYYYQGYYTFTHDEWSSDVTDGVYYTYNYSFGDHTEYHYGSSAQNIYNRYQLPVIIPVNTILLCASQADVDISYPTGGYVEGVVSGSFKMPPGFHPLLTGIFTETAVIDF